MATIKQLDSIYNTQDGKKILITLFMWGELALTGEDFARFDADREIILDSYMDQYARGVYTITPITEIVTTSNQETINLRVGYIYTRPDDYEHHPKYAYWNEQFMLDPNVEYYPEVIIG